MEALSKLGFQNLNILKSLTFFLNENHSKISHQKPNIKKKCICTHSGNFHCDEAMGIWMLKQLDQYKDSEIIRTRDQNLIDQSDIVVDVGAVFDPTKNRFDHHQREFNQTFDENHKVKLSSAGLIYKYFGKEVLANLIDELDESTMNQVYNLVYDNLIQSVDGIDNGVLQYPSDITPAYKISTDLASRISRLNPAWNEKDVNVESRFQEAIEIAGNEFLDAAIYYSKRWFPARSIVENAVKSRGEIDASGEIIFLEQYCPWKEHLFNIEKEFDIDGKIKYCVYRNNLGNFSVQCTSSSPNSFENRLSLPEPWRGLRDEELSKLAKIPDCIFVHSNGFIGGAKTKESAISMARISLNYTGNQ